MDYFFRKSQYLFILSLCVIISFQELSAQSTAIETTVDATYNKAVDHYERGEFILAFPLFEQVYIQQHAEDKLPYSTASRNLFFYIYDCLLRLDKDQAEEPAMHFIEREDPVIRKNRLSYQLAAFYFRRGDYQSAMEYDARAGVEGLSRAEINISKFRKAYGLFYFKRYEEAKQIFESIIQIRNHPHYADAQYYYGFIMYEKNDYKSALNAFEEVRTHPKYTTKVPYYLTSVYFNTGASDKAIQEGEAALKRSDIESKNEIRRLLGHIYYDRRKYELALPLLESYVAGQSKVGRDVYFELHDVYYRLRKYDKAIAGLKQLSEGQDKLSQFAMYILADAYLQTGQKEKARNAFSFAASNNSDSVQKEVSLFMLGKLSAETGYQGEAITTLQQFIHDYPQSNYNSEAKELLVGLLAASNNYKDALALLETMDKPTEKVKKIIPVIQFGRAAEWLNDQQFEDAELLLDNILKTTDNVSVLPLAEFWKGELTFRKGDTESAKKYYLSFLKSGHKGQGEANVRTANYNVAYCYLKAGQYLSALSHFEKAIPSIKSDAGVFEQDAYIRQADCHFMLKQFPQAKAAYQKVIEFKWKNADYATYQKALIIGINNSKAKIEILKSMEFNYPTSTLLGEAVMEIAKTLMAEERFKEAIPYLNAVAQSDTSHPYHLDALLQLATAWYNIDEDEKALAQYQRIIQEAPYSAAAEEAMENIKTIYLQSGRSDLYEEQMRAWGKEISVLEADSLAYASVELKLAADDCKAVIKLAEQYLKRFPEGMHVLDALFHKSECYFRNNDKPAALKGYQEICAKGNSSYMDKAAMIVARTYFFDLKDYAGALFYYELLYQYAANEDQKTEALRGSIRCLYHTKNADKGASVARELLLMKNASTDDKALSYLMMGRNEQLTGSKEKAIASYKQTLSLHKGEWAAEAGYARAYCLYELKQYENAEKAAFEVVNKSGSYTAWVTRSYLLLGDIYWAQQDYFNAKATYQSVADHTIDSGLKKEASDKLDQVKAAEQKDSKIIHP
jgi:tetratricopeptide (TPR) repeat protein